jgi:hypothetical protein
MDTTGDSTTSAAGKYPMREPDESVKSRAMDWVAAFWEGNVFAPVRVPVAARAGARQAHEAPEAHTTPEPDDIPPPKNDPIPQEVPQPDPPPVQDPMPHQEPQRLN